MKRVILVFFLLFSVPIFAETTGVINFSFANVSIVSGLTAYTVNLCNSTANCLGLTCFIDYDAVSSPGSSGWCNSTGISSCYHNNSEYGTGTNICDTNTTYRTCSSGNWSSVTSCSSGQTCPSSFGTPGNCSTPSSSSSGSSAGSTTANVTQKYASIIFVSSPLDFDMVQGDSVLKYATLKNNGNLTLYNVSTSSSLTWASIMPRKYNQSVKNNETTFEINFTAPEDAAVKVYVVTLSASTSNASVTASKSLNLTVKPSNKTVQEQIFPEYGRYVPILAELEANMTQLEARGADVNELKALLLEARSKLLQVNRSLESKDYVSASNLLADVNNALSSAANKINAIELPVAASQDFTLFIAIVIIAAVIMFLLYLLWPSKQPKSKPPVGFIGREEEKKSFFQKPRGKSKKQKG